MHLMLSLVHDSCKHRCRDTSLISPANKLYQAQFKADLQFALSKAHAEQTNVHNFNQPGVVHIAHAPEATTLLSHFSSALQDSASVSLRDLLCA